LLSIERLSLSGVRRFFVTNDTAFFVTNATVPLSREIAGRNIRLIDAELLTADGR
jgi:hypothetical protein